MSERKSYEAPKITRVKLEDRAVVAQTACKDSIDTQACSRVDCLLFDEANNCVKSQIGPGFDLSPS